MSRGRPSLPTGSAAGGAFNAALDVPTTPKRDNTRSILRGLATSPRRFPRRRPQLGSPIRKLNEQAPIETADFSAEQQPASVPLSSAEMDEFLVDEAFQDTDQPTPRKAPSFAETEPDDDNDPTSEAAGSSIPANAGPSDTQVNAPALASPAQVSVLAETPVSKQSSRASAAATNLLGDTQTPSILPHKRPGNSYGANNSALMSAIHFSQSTDALRSNDSPVIRRPANPVTATARSPARMTRSVQPVNQHAPLATPAAQIVPAVGSDESPAVPPAHPETHALSDTTPVLPQTPKARARRTTMDIPERNNQGTEEEIWAGEEGNLLGPERRRRGRRRSLTPQRSALLPGFDEGSDDEQKSAPPTTPRSRSRIVMDIPLPRAGDDVELPFADEDEINSPTKIPVDAVEVSQRQLDIADEQTPVPRRLVLAASEPRRRVTAESPLLRSAKRPRRSLGTPQRISNEPDDELVSDDIPEELDAQPTETTEEQPIDSEPANEVDELSDPVMSAPSPGRADRSVQAGLSFRPRHTPRIGRLVDLSRKLRLEQRKPETPAQKGSPIKRNPTTGPSIKRTPVLQTTPLSPPRRAPIASPSKPSQTTPAKATPNADTSNESTPQRPMQSATKRRAQAAAAVTTPIFSLPTRRRAETPPSASSRSPLKNAGRRVPGPETEAVIAGVPVDDPADDEPEAFDAGMGGYEDEMDIVEPVHLSPIERRGRVAIRGGPDENSFRRRRSQTPSGLRMLEALKTFGRTPENLPRASRARHAPGAWWAATTTEALLNDASKQQQQQQQQQAQRNKRRRGARSRSRSARPPTRRRQVLQESPQQQTRKRSASQRTPVPPSPSSSSKKQVHKRPRLQIDDTPEPTPTMGRSRGADRRKRPSELGGPVSSIFRVRGSDVTTKPSSLPPTPVVAITATKRHSTSKSFQPSPATATSTTKARTPRSAQRQPGPITHDFDIDE
ncbi:hypothetical protein PYCC9005_003850 [Savitreella phatthalungensis]